MAESLVFPVKDFDIAKLRATINEADQKGKYQYDKNDMVWYLVYWFIGQEQVETDSEYLEVKLDCPRRSDLTWRDARQVIKYLLAPFYLGPRPQFVRLDARDLDWDGGETAFYENIEL